MHRHGFHLVCIVVLPCCICLALQDPEVEHIAKKNGKTVAQILLRWGLEHATSVIPKSTNPKHTQASDCALSVQSLWPTLY